MKGKRYLYFISSVATMGGLMFGFDVGIISGAIPFIQPYFGWNELQLGWGVSSILVGAIIGAFGSGVITERYGRKNVLIVVALFFAVSCAGMALATTADFFIFARIIGGLAVGAVSVLSPMYVAEIAPSKIRGVLITIYQLAITMGILISYIVNYGLHEIENNWRWMFATGLIPSVLFFVGLIFIPESPRWLMTKGLKEKALMIMKRIDGTEKAQVAIKEIELSLTDSKGKINLLSLFKPVYRKVMLLGLLLTVFVQISGINTVIDYAPKILMAAGLEIKNALLQTSLIGIVNFAFAFFAACIGPAFWTLVAEMFPNKIRGTAIAMISFTQWTLNFIVVLLFPHLLKAIGGSMTFLFLAVMSAGQLLIAWFFIKETKGKTLEEIEKMWVE